jgi:NADH-quinone oxidoreductase subunit N
VPPTVGFWAKLFVLEAVVSIDMTWLAIVAVAFSIIGAFYYLRVVKFMYFDKPIDDMPVEVGGAAQFTLGLNGIAMLALGFFPTLIMAFLHV